MKILNETKGLSDVSRRSFLKGTAALGAMSMLYGCSKDDGSEMIYVGGGGTGGTTPVPELESHFVYGTAMHNCGGKCISRAEVSNGRIIRILSDEAEFTANGEYLDPQSRNRPQLRACSKCRSYKYRVYHPGRLRYPLKQTRKRGDLNGFMRISWEQAIKEIAAKHKAVINEWGPDAIYAIYASGASGPNGSSGIGTAIRYMVGSTYSGGPTTSTWGSYSSHQFSYLGYYTSGIGSNTENMLNCNMTAKYCKTLIMWGDNSMTTRNNNIYAGVKTAEDMKVRDPNSKIYFIGPELCDGGVTLADEWVASKPYTDGALIAGMLYHMLDNTFDLTNGSLKPNPWLDVNYLDTMVYGFFDSPAHLLNEDTGDMDAAVPQPAAVDPQRSVPAVPAGRSYCSWILGNNGNARTYDALGKDMNYTAMQYAAGDSTFKRWAPCSYERSAQTAYKTKQDFQKPKTTQWASEITGIPVATIEQMAYDWVFNGPVSSHWSGGMQKSSEGVACLWALQSLHIITKNAGEYGAGFGWYYGARILAASGGLSNPSIPRSIPAGAAKPAASCTAWHTTIKAVYGDELRQNGYTAKYIPNWTPANGGTLRSGAEDVYWDDGGSKAAVYQWKRTGTIVDVDPMTGHYVWEKNLDNSPRYAGIRMMYNNGGGIPVNQHENSNDSADVLEHLNLSDHSLTDSFCLVTFDNFLHPSTRYGDYVLPASTTWEHSNYCTPDRSAGMYVPPVTTPPGEARGGWDVGVHLLSEYERIEPAADGAAADYCGGDTSYTFEYWARRRYYEGPYQNINSPFYQKSWDDYLKNPWLPSSPHDEYMPLPSQNYHTVQSYKQHVAAGNLMLPFIKIDAAWNANNPVHKQYIKTNEYYEGGYGNNYDDATILTAPKSSLRFHVYSPVLTWQYVNRFNKWHGELEPGLRGQPHKDIEGDRIVIEIPAYFAYEDYHMEAYGGANRIADLPFLLTTTHDRYRSHSSVTENPMLRELNHRVPGRDAKGNFLPANDFNRYMVGPDQEMAVNTVGLIPGPSAAMNADGTVSEANKAIVSYSEIWINETDGRDLLNLQDGDLVQVENPIGAVRCVARLTKRCVRGFVGLHQGALYDPRPIANSYGHASVDVGGCCNTLMASQPSRIDHGNGQQTAMVKIFKVENY